MASSAARESRVDGDELLLEPQATTRELRAWRLALQHTHWVDTLGSSNVVPPLDGRKRKPHQLTARRMPPQFLRQLFDLFVKLTSMRRTRQKGTYDREAQLRPALLASTFFVIRHGTYSLSSPQAQYAPTYPLIQTPSMASSADLQRPSKISRR